MELFIGIILFLFLIIVCNKLSRFFFDTADYVSERKRDKEYYENKLLEALLDIRDSVVPEVIPENNVKRLLNANKEIIEKAKLNEAIEKELLIEMHPQIKRK